MELYIDSADLETAKKIMEYYPVDGITTNPKILSKSSITDSGLLIELKKFIDTYQANIFVQTTGETAEEIEKQAVECQKYFGNALIIKIPAVREGYKAVRPCKRHGIKVCVTVVHSMMQGLVAAKAGADYVAPYITHIDNSGADGVQTVRDMITAFRQGNYGCKVLGASFRTVDQIKRLAIVGCDAITIAPDFFDALIAHSSTDASMEGFRNAWSDKFGSLQINDLIPE